MEQANPEEMELGKGAVDLVEESENKDLELQEDSADFNPLLKAALIGDTEEVQHIFEDSEDPDNDKATEFLKVTDVVGRSLLYTTCMSGQSDVIRTMARYGVDLKETTVREAKQNLRNFISQIQATITDPEKVQGRLNKEDKNTSLKACQAKSDWLESIKEPTMEDFLDQKQQLEEIMLPIFTKLATPRGQDSVVNKKIGNPSADRRFQNGRRVNKMAPCCFLGQIPRKTATENGHPMEDLCWTKSTSDM
ncbi:ankyrin repeat domain-containing protein 45 isoform X7 [Pogona vitticeps]